MRKEDCNVLNSELCLCPDCDNKNCRRHDCGCCKEECAACFACSEFKKIGA